MSTYQISDVPQLTGRARWVVNPMFPLLAAMLGGALPAWVWFSINSVAMNSPTRRGDIAIASTGLIISALMVGSILLATGQGHISTVLMPYCLLLVTVMKLSIAYTLYMRQAQPYAVFSYYHPKSSPHGPQLVMFTMALRFLQPFPTLVALVLF